MRPAAARHAEALLDCSGEAASRCPRAAHVAVCSGHDVPVAAVPAGALKPGMSLFTDFRWGAGVALPRLRSRGRGPSVLACASRPVHARLAPCMPLGGAAAAGHLATCRPPRSNGATGPLRFGYAWEEAAQADVAAALQERLGFPQDEAAAWGGALLLHHTWMVLAR